MLDAASLSLSSSNLDSCTVITFQLAGLESGRALPLTAFLPLSYLRIYTSLFHTNTRTNPIHFLSSSDTY